MRLCKTKHTLNLSNFAWSKFCSDHIHVCGFSGVTDTVPLWCVVCLSKHQLLCQTESIFMPTSQEDSYFQVVDFQRYFRDSQSFHFWGLPSGLSLWTFTQAVSAALLTYTVVTGSHNSAILDWLIFDLYLDHVWMHSPILIWMDKCVQMLLTGTVYQDIEHILPLFHCLWFLLWTGITSAIRKLFFSLF